MPLNKPKFIIFNVGLTVALITVLVVVIMGPVRFDARNVHAYFETNCTVWNITTDFSRCCELTSCICYCYNAPPCSSVGAVAGACCTPEICGYMACRIVGSGKNEHEECHFVMTATQHTCMKECGRCTHSMVYYEFLDDGEPRIGYFTVDCGRDDEACFNKHKVGDMLSCWVNSYDASDVKFARPHIHGVYYFVIALFVLMIIVQNLVMIAMARGVIIIQWFNK